MARKSGGGIWLAVLGPDGSGKTALIDHLRRDLSKGFAEIHRYHLRPHFGRPTHAFPPVTRPHAQSARALLPSLMKLLFWFADYWIGYLLLVRPQVKAGGLVLFDRYAHDLLVDPQRYRLPLLALGCARLLAAAVPLPNLFILLYAPATVLQERKSEVSFLESQRQGHEYIRLIESLPNSLVIDARRPLDDVADEARRCIAAFCGHLRRPSSEVRFVGQ